MAVNPSDRDPHKDSATLTSFSRKYVPWPIKRDPITLSTDNTGKMLKFSIGNVKWAKFLGSLRNSDVRNSVIVLRKTYYDLSRDISNSVVLFKGRIANLMFNEHMVSVTASDLTWDFGTQAPDKIYSVSCAHIFKNRVCGYLGPDSTCNKSLAACETKRNSGRFGGFPQVSDGQIRNFVA